MITKIQLTKIEQVRLSEYTQSIVKKLSDNYFLNDDEIREVINTAILVVNNEKKQKKSKT